jgi:hypothetical protein
MSAVEVIGMAHPKHIALSGARSVSRKTNLIGFSKAGVTESVDRSRVTINRA